MSVTTFYLFGRTTIRNVAEKVAGPPSGPALASKLANPDTKALDATDHILKFTLPDHASYEKQRAKKQASLEKAATERWWLMMEHDRYHECIQVGNINGRWKVIATSTLNDLAQ